MSKQRSRMEGGKKKGRRGREREREGERERERERERLITALCVIAET